MSHDIPASFIKDYDADVKLAYQRFGSKLRGTVRTKNNIVGESTTFQKIGKGEMAQKTRHGDVPTMNLDHTPVLLTLEDWYAGEYIDKLDELKINIDERMSVAKTSAAAAGRKTDALIITAMEAATQIVAHGSAGMTEAKVDTALETLDDNDVPLDDGEIYCVVGIREWNELIKIAAFSSADYVAANELPYAGRGMYAKWWRGIMWFTFSGLPVATNIRSCYMYHKTSTGHGIGEEVTTDITWQGEKAAHFFNTMLSMGAVIIDDEGIVEILCDES